MPRCVLYLAPIRRNICAHGATKVSVLTSTNEGAEKGAEIVFWVSISASQFFCSPLLVGKEMIDGFLVNPRQFHQLHYIDTAVSAFGHEVGRAAHHRGDLVLTQSGLYLSAQDS
jgi:hypothetical protein